MICTIEFASSKMRQVQTIDRARHKIKLFIELSPWLALLSPTCWSTQTSTHTHTNETPHNHRSHLLWVCMGWWSTQQVAAALLQWMNPLSLVRWVPKRVYVSIPNQPINQLTETRLHNSSQFAWRYICCTNSHGKPSLARTLLLYSLMNLQTNKPTSELTN